MIPAQPAHHTPHFEIPALLLQTSQFHVGGKTKAEPVLQPIMLLLVTKATT
jgi:hypothetical protein